MIWSFQNSLFSYHILNFQRSNLGRYIIVVFCVNLRIHCEIFVLSRRGHVPTWEELRCFNFFSMTSHAKQEPIRMLRVFFLGCCSFFLRFDWLLLSFIFCCLYFMVHISDGFSPSRGMKSENVAWPQQLTLPFPVFLTCNSENGYVPFPSCVSLLHFLLNILYIC